MFSCFVKVDNDVLFFDFSSRINVSEGVTWSLYSDSGTKEEITSKIGGLNVGSNMFYVKTTFDGAESSIFIFNIKRLDMFTVTFDTKGGNQIPSRKVQEESLVGDVDNPIKKGFNFIKWDYDFDTPVTSDLTISAIWEESVYNVYLDVNGGDALAVDLIEITYGKYLSLPIPTYYGHEFLGWYENEQKYESGTWEYDHDVHLIARWDFEVYEVTYDLNGGYMNISSGTISTTFTEKPKFI